MRLIEQVADARTPADALTLIRDWLEDAGQPVSAMLLHRERTDVANAAQQDWAGMESISDLKYEIESLKKDLKYEVEAARDVAFDEGRNKGFEEGFAAGVASMTPLVEAPDAD